MIKPFSAREMIARVNAQIEIAAAQKASRDRLEAMLFEAPAAISVMRGPSLVYVVANERYEQLVGKRDLIGKPLRLALPELASQGVFEIYERVYATGERFAADAFGVMLARGDHGTLEQGFFNGVVQATRTPDGVIDGVLSFTVEVTDQVLARQEVDRVAALEHSLRATADAATVSANAANRAKDDFLAMLGHELRNPLAPISTALQLMRMNGTMGGEKERQIIERQVDHLKALVDDLLDVSRIAQGKIELDRHRIEVSDPISAALEVASPLLEQQRHTVTVDVPTTGLVVNGDVGRLRQVFTNLITNAAKYTPADGAITITARMHDGHVVVRVTDNGVGIRPDMLPRVFDLFSQAPQSLARSEGGLGLGLSIVRSIVQLHEGRVYAESPGSGRGSTFTVELPVVAASAAGAGTSSTTMRRVAAIPTIGKRILVVDDNRDAADLLSDLLERLGHTTKVVYDGPGTLAVLATFTPAVVLLDIGLPGINGYELARILRRDPTLTGVKLVAITGYGQAEDRRRTQEAGFDAHLVKPLNLDVLAEVLNRS